MASSYMQMIYIDDEDCARQTNVGAAMSTDDATRAAFDSYRTMEVNQDAAKFLLDYYDSNGDLIDTILLDATGFEAISGEMAKTDAEYVQIDNEYWAEARVQHEAAKAKRAGA